MPALYTETDALREFLTGAAADGLTQSDTDLSLGGYRALEQSSFLAMEFAGSVKHVQVLGAPSSNPLGDGSLVVYDEVSLTWQPPDAVVPGPVEVFTLNETDTRNLQGPDPTQFLQVTATPPFVPGTQIVTLTEVLENVFGLTNVLSADATAGITQYRATILKNVSQGDVTLVKRWIDQLATQCISTQAQLGGSGSGALQTASYLTDWPASGWCQIRDAGAIREVVYYSSRTDHTLTIPAAGRGLLGTSAAAGAATDTLHSVPGIALALAVSGVQAPGAAIATIANDVSAPAGVSWNLGITSATGLQITRLAPGEQIGVWVRRHIPAGAVLTPNVYNRIKTSFTVN